MNGLAFTAESIGRIHMFGITDEWSDDFRLPAGSHGLKMVNVGDIACALAARRCSRRNNARVQFLRSGQMEALTLRRRVGLSIQTPGKCVPLEWCHGSVRRQDSSDVRCQSPHPGRETAA